MKRLIEKNINSKEEYERIFVERTKQDPQWDDLRRWEKLLNRYQGGNLIDVGCFDSMVVNMAREKDKKADILGVDFVPRIINLRREIDPKINFQVGSVYNLPAQDNYFDYAVMGEVLEHLEKPKEAIKEAVRILKPGGILSISTPLEEEKEFGAVDADRHLWSFDQEDLEMMLGPYGKVEFEVLRSQQEPVYKYSWPVIVAWMTKK